MKRSAPIYLLALCIFSLFPVGVFWNWMAAVDSLRPYSTHVFVLMILLALTAMVLVPFATRAFFGKGRD